MKHVYERFLDRLLAVYGEPNSDDPALFVREYARVLEQYAAEELARAGDAVIESHKYAGWPKIHDCVAACNDARRSIALARSGEVPKAGTKGTGSRLSDSGRKWFQIDRGSPEFAAWMRFYRGSGRHDFAGFVELYGRSLTLGPSPLEHGVAMLAYLDANKPKSMGGI